MSQPRRAAHGSAPRDSESADRVVVVEPAGDGWRVQAAHMEPLRFRTEAEAERAGRRVARTLARLGLDARLDTLDAAGRPLRSELFPGETRRPRLGRQPRLDS